MAELTSPWPAPASFDSVAGVQEALTVAGYIPDDELATAVFLAARMRRPLLLEGEAGVGKTEVARTVAALSGAELIRLQCHESIDASTALYDWDYRRQLLALRATGDQEAGDDALYSRRFLLRRPLLEAIESERPVVLLIDEVDRSDEQFEALLLELLADFQVSIPELGTIVADVAPFVVLTSNRTRELHDALKRRCLYHWIEYPSRERELEIVRLRCPGVAAEIAERVTRAAQKLRHAGLYKPPGVGETLAWAEALDALGDGADLASTLGVALKVQEDIEHVRRAHVLDEF
jgi:MoxR-like ATPase